MVKSPPLVLRAPYRELEPVEIAEPARCIHCLCELVHGTCVDELVETMLLDLGGELEWSAHPSVKARMEKTR